MKKAALVLLALALVSCRTGGGAARSGERAVCVSGLERLAENYGNGDYDGALEAIGDYEANAAELDDTQRALVHYVKGLCVLKKGHYPEALAEFEKSKKNLPAKLESELYANIGVAYFYLGQIDRARENTSKSLSLSWSTETMDNLMYMRGIRGIDEMSLLPLPGKFSIYQAQGWLYYYMGDYPASIFSFRKMIELEPDFVMGYLALGIVYETCHNYPSALEYYTKALKRDAAYPDVWNDLGIVYYHLRRYRDAEGAFLKAIELNPDYPHPYSNLGFFCLETGDLAGAESRFRDAIRKNASDPFLLGESHAGLAVVRYRKGDRAEAAALKKKAVKSNYKLNNPHYLRLDLKWEDATVDDFLRVETR